MRLPRPNSADSVGAIVLLAVDIWFNVSVRSPTPPIGWSLVFIAVGTLPLAWRRVAPIGVFSVLAAAALAGTVLAVAISEAGLLVGLYSVAAWRPRWTAVRCAVGFGAVKTPIEVAQETEPTWIPVLLVLYATATVLGDQQRAHRELAAREHSTRERLVIAAERAAIAREMHDVVAHTVSVMILYSSVARRALTEDPARADTALVQVAESGRESLAELRRLLGALRTEPADLAPHPDLASLEELVARFAAAELPVRLRIRGNRRALPAGVELCAYRIVQEALTNAAKHARPTEVTVDLEFRDTDLAIGIDNDGVSPDRGVPGHGLVGMRERAALVGGAVRIHGGRTDFRVTATLPYPG
ncbi:histidine kinase [Actinokineospora guangxiensis]|uniref:histidine kinase n=1 Tax=Actinokineospora guangxiensis TaxID=1490288 RepID=A0ABW0ERS1_9PSEU